MNLIRATPETQHSGTVKYLKFLFEFHRNQMFSIFGVTGLKMKLDVRLTLQRVVRRGDLRNPPCLTIVLSLLNSGTLL